MRGLGRGQMLIVEVRPPPRLILDMLSEAMQLDAEQLSSQYKRKEFQSIVNLSQSDPN